MAGGTNINRMIMTSEKPDSVAHTMIGSVSGAKGCTVTSAGPGMVSITRKFRPTWALVWGIILFFFTIFGIGLVFITRSETATVSISSVDGGTRVLVSGITSSEVQSRLDGALNALAPIQ
jgi:hypothetical protein